jgi:hypothetical protein
MTSQEKNSNSIMRDLNCSDLGNEGLLSLFQIGENDLGRFVTGGPKIVTELGRMCA